MKDRRILAIFSSLLEEAALVAVVLWGLPRLGINIPLPGLIALMVALAAFSVYTYRSGSRALARKPMVGLPSMIGSKAKAVSQLAPDGTVKAQSELWEAMAIDGTIEDGEEVTVVGQDALKLIVRRRTAEDAETTG